MPSKDVKCKKKNAGFSAFHLENEFKKNVNSCRAASQPIPLIFLEEGQMICIPKISQLCLAWLLTRSSKTRTWKSRRPHGLVKSVGKSQVKTCERNGRDGGWGRGAQLLMILRVCKRYRGSGKEQVVFQFVTKRLFTANHPNTHHVPVQDPRFWFVLSPKSRSRRPKAGA